MSENSQPSERVDWTRVPVVLVQRPACPFCRHERYDKDKTRRTAADDTLKFCRCRNCGREYVIRLDSPDLGLDVFWPT